MVKSGEAWLQVRLNELDSGLVWHPTFVTDDPLLRFVRVMSSWTDTRMVPNNTMRVLLDSDAADAMIERCGLLREIAETDRELVRGPVRLDRQSWIGVGHWRRMGTAGQLGPFSDQPPALLPASFVAPSDAAPARPSAKPYRLGLYTSTIASTGRSMWRVFLELGTEASLHRRPWSVYELQPTRAAKVLEIASARAWCVFVQRYAKVADDLLYPNWPQVARDFDAVHMTLAAIVATQGFAFPSSPYAIAAAYWDVETTLWLRWCFASIRLREVVR